MPRVLLSTLALLRFLAACADPISPCADPVAALPEVDPLPADCDQAGERLTCAHDTLALDLEDPVRETREVHFAAPQAPPPTAGWPVAILFQGSFFSAEVTWSASVDDLYGAFWQTSVVRALLEAGFLVVTPEATLDGAGAWDTNLVGWRSAWESSPDHALMGLLLDGLGEGRFGPADPDRLHAAGISSGGYMTSRMALSYPGVFRRLAIQSGSWATCAGFLCDVPDTLPSDHPPTLFLHGEEDLTVPIDTMIPYAEGLRDQGTTCRTVVDPDVGHAWLDVAPDEVRGWFLGG